MSLLVTLVGHVAVNSCGSMYLIQGMTIKNYVKVTKIAGDDTYSPQIAVADGIMTVNTYNTDGCSFSIVKLFNS